jgi:hypothetical protein
MEEHKMKLAMEMKVTILEIKGPVVWKCLLISEGNFSITVSSQGSEIQQGQLLMHSQANAVARSFWKKRKKKKAR